MSNGIIDVDGEEVREDGTLIPAPAPQKHWRCEKCLRPVPTYVGRCPGCSLVNTLRLRDGPCPELPRRKPPQDQFAGLRAAPDPRMMMEDRYAGSQPIGEVEEDFEPCERILTGISSLDRVLGPHDHGAAQGAVVLVGGWPGSRKSTLLLQAMAGIAERGETVLYASGEQMKLELVDYAVRLGLLSDTVRQCLRVLRTTSYEQVEEEVAMHDPVAIVLDSLNVTSTMRVDGEPGDAKQAEEIMKALYEMTVDRKLATFVVSQVTKDGDLAGSMVVQHASHVIAKMRLLEDPEERVGLVSVVGDVDVNGEPTRLVEFVCPKKNRFGREGVRGNFIVGESGLLQSIELQEVANRRRMR